MSIHVHQMYREKACTNPDSQMRIRAHFGAEEGSVIISKLHEYVGITAILKFMGRELERETSTVVDAVNGMLKLINRHDQAWQTERPAQPGAPPVVPTSKTFFICRATATRFMKFYATSEVPLVFALLCGGVWQALGKLIECAEFVTEVKAVMLPALSSHVNPVICTAASVWDSWISVSDFESYPEVFHKHHSVVENDLHPIRRLAESLGYISSSEAAAERSFSRHKRIRHGRHSLTNERAEAELIFAFNPIDMSDLTQVSIVEPVGEDSLREAPRDVVEKAFGPRTVSQVSENPSPDPTAPSETAASKKILSPRNGSQVVVMWWYHRKYYSALRAGDKVVFKNAARNGWTSGVVENVNRKSFRVWVKLKRGESHYYALFDLYDAVALLLQRESAKLFDFPNSNYAIPHNTEMKRYKHMDEEAEFDIDAVTLQLEVGSTMPVPVPTA